MTTLEKIAEKTEAVLSLDEGLQFPDLSVQTKDYIEAYRALGLTNHESDLHFYAKCEIAKKVGLQQVTGEDVTRMLIGDENAKVKTSTKWSEVDIEEFYDPLFNEVYRASYQGRTFHPPFWSTAAWEPIHMV